MIIKMRTLQAVSCVAICGTVVFNLGCGCGLPFPSNDPPPTFAVSYTIQSQSPDYPVIPYIAGTLMNGVYAADIGSSGIPFVPTGSEQAFEAQVDSCGYYIAENSRWPALWYITPETGPCAGSRANALITTKNSSSVCKIGLVTPIEIAPGSYVGTAPPA
jgi:hypothetical protein